jgi:hypothetical protein
MTHASPANMTGGHMNGGMESVLVARMSDPSVPIAMHVKTLAISLRARLSLL